MAAAISTEAQLVVTDSGKRYILQQINNTIFEDVDALMENIIAVTGHIAKNDPDPRHVLTLVPTVDGKAYYKDAEGRLLPRVRLH